MKKSKHITDRKIKLVFFFVDLFFVLPLAFLSFYQLKETFGDIIGLGPVRIFGNFSAPVDMFILVIYWLIVFSAFGHYSRNINQSVFTIVSSTLKEVIAGNLVFFLVVFGPLKMFEYEHSWITFVKISVQFFVIMVIPRIVVFIILNKLFDWGYIKFSFVILGRKDIVNTFLSEFDHSGYFKKYKPAGIMFTDEAEKRTGPSGIPAIVSLAHLDKMASEGKVDEIIYLEPANDLEGLRQVITLSKKYNLKLNIPGQLTDILKGQVTIKGIESPPFVVVHSKELPLVQLFTKRVLDVFISAVSLILLLPLFPFIVYSIKKSSPGPVFFVQERIGKNGVPFKMYKFRTMFDDVEKGVPALSYARDPRVTKAGRWLRRWRMDELPQLVNVLSGKMSLVGPRPERQFYMEQILEKAPYYSLILKVKPGITSLGMVRFGYAENVDQMIQRLNYDILYVENQSLMLDIKILFYTIGTLLKGEGK